MFLKYLLLVFVVKGMTACLYDTFHNTSVTLTGVRDIKTIDGCFEPEKNIETVALIQILNETVPVLYEDAFNNLEHLLDIILENNSIQEIRPGAFKNLPKLYLIRLKHNNFREIREGVFNNLPLTELSLVDNNIQRIHTRAFDNLPNLNIIVLSENKLATWDANWFKGTPKLSVLKFDNNLITVLPSRAFRNIYGVNVIKNLNVSTSIHLNNNKIHSLEDAALDGPSTLGWLFLQHNELQEIKSQSLGNLRQVDWLRLDYNNLECIPEILIQIAPNVKYYLDGNPLTEDCMTKFEIKQKNNGNNRLNKFHVTINY